MTVFAARGHLALILIALAPALAFAQTPAAPESRGLWIVAGGSSTTLLGDCTGCEAKTYLHTGSVMGIVGKSITRRTRGGLEIMWVPGTAVAGGTVPIRTTYIMGTAEFHPWSGSFFVRFSSGMAFVRNWTIELNGETPPLTSKAFALGLAAGWEWRFTRRFGAQVFGAQHVAALGDLTAGDTTAENVIGNYWSVGGAVVIR